MAISYVSSASAAANTVAMPSHQAGDLILVFAYRDGSNSPPTTPAGFTPVPGGVNGIANNSARLGLKWAESSSEIVGTWSGATGVVVHVYRGASGLGSDPGNWMGGGGVITYHPDPLEGDDGTSWLVGFAGHCDATNLTANTPTGYTHRTGVPTEVRGLDSNGPLTSSPGDVTQSTNGTQPWFSRTVELLAAPTGLPVKVYLGGSWVQKPMKRYNGSAWVEVNPKIHDGTDWI